MASVCTAYRLLRGLPRLPFWCSCSRVTHFPDSLQPREHGRGDGTCVVTSHEAVAPVLRESSPLSPSPRLPVGHRGDLSVARNRRQSPPDSRLNVRNVTTLGKKVNQERLGHTVTTNLRGCHRGPRLTAARLWSVYTWTLAEDVALPRTPHPMMTLPNSAQKQHMPCRGFLQLL